MLRHCRVPARLAFGTLPRTSADEEAVVSEGLEGVVAPPGGVQPRGLDSGDGHPAAERDGVARGGGGRALSSDEGP